MAETELLPHLTDEDIEGLRGCWVCHEVPIGLESRESLAWKSQHCQPGTEGAHQYCHRSKPGDFEKTLEAMRNGTYRVE